MRALLLVFLLCFSVSKETESSQSFYVAPDIRERPLILKHVARHHFDAPKNLMVGSFQGKYIFMFHYAHKQDRRLPICGKAGIAYGQYFRFFQERAAGWYNGCCGWGVTRFPAFYFSGMVISAKDALK